MKEKIGNRLKKIRKERGITQKGLAEKIEGKIDYTYIGKIERGEQLPSLKILKKIADALSVPLNFFFYDEKVSIPLNLLPTEVLETARDEKKRELLRTFNAIHEADIPFIVEIANILRRHREISGRPETTSVEEEKYLMVAEEGERYEGRGEVNKLTKEIDTLLKTEEDEKVKNILKRVLRELRRGE